MHYVVFAAFVFVAMLVPGCARALIARLGGMCVTRLMIGFGPRVAAVELGGTRLQLHAFPFGAFSQVAGLVGVDRPVPPGARDAFANRPVVAKLLVLFAGAIGLFTCAIIIAVAANLAWGVPTLAATPIVDGVIDGKPAARAGLVAGDAILAIDDVAMIDPTQVPPAIAASRGALRIRIRRDDQTRTLTVIPVEESGDRRIGITIGRRWIHERGSPRVAISDGIRRPFALARYIAATFIAGVSQSRRITTSGPIGIARSSVREMRDDGQHAAGVFEYLLVYFALFMLVPVVPYDGGRALARLLRRRPPRDLPAARDLGAIPFTPPPFAPVDIVMLVLFSLAALPLFGSAFSPIAMIIAFVGLLRRRPLAWSFAAATSPAVAFSAVFVATLGVGWLRLGTLAVAPLWLAVALWLRSAGVRARFGLLCPSCRERDVRPVLGSDGTLSCLACGSCWRRG